MIQLSVERGEMLLSPRVPEGLQHIKVPGAQPQYGMWGANKLLLQSKPTSEAMIHDAYISQLESNQLVAQCQKGVLLFHLSLEGSIQYTVEGLSTILLHERAYTFYYVPFWLAHVASGLSANHSLLICIDPAYLHSFGLRFPHIRVILQRIKASHPVAVSDTPFIADYNLLSRVHELQRSSEDVSTVNLLYEVLDMALNKILHRQPAKPLQVSQEQIEKYYLVRRTIMANLQTEYTLRELAALADLNYYEVRDLFPRLFGVTTKNMLLEARMAYTEKELNAGQKMPAIAKALGYKDESGLRRAFTRFFGLAPNDYRLKFRKNNDEFGILAYQKSG
ncbi:helix-turn-helix transcriptional regulator [Pseudoflavitalea sp. X16]|uniref:helix-turn-helix domain-containing protein n=1 Tax=Paraflavitalea devenefica TaxID=2716334 RepID=UPI0014219882|nr:AraC family transcriptional regulator [Paraflavitalea devenefica]NII26128.1 helix-turn-helix transcriptional regulator [Paraflavitalea devenefica]